MARFLSAAAVAVALVLGACGGSSTPAGPAEEATLLLDFAPNAVHAPIYVAREREFDRAEGVTLKIRRPGASTDALKLLQSRRADMAILDIHDLGLALEKGRDLVGVMAIVQRPLAALLAQPSVDSPRDLEGQRVGVTGLPSDEAVLRSIVAGDEGDPGKVRSVTIGFEAVKALLARRVAAATAFWNAEGVALRRRRPGIREFRVDDFGAPADPELVLVVTRRTLDERRPLVRATVQALRRGYERVAADPESAASTMADAVRGLDREALSAELDAVLPVMAAGAPAYGVLDPAKLRAWNEWDVEFRILERPVDVARGFDVEVSR